jgi:hypothetical protein
MGVVRVDEDRLVRTKIGRDILVARLEKRLGSSISILML